jgi:hypothetical protein
MTGYFRRKVVFMEGRNSILNIFGGGYSEMLQEILKLTDRNVNRFSSNKENRYKIMTKLRITQITYQRRLKWLRDKRIILPVKEGGRGVYHFNREIIRFQ